MPLLEARTALSPITMSCSKSLSKLEGAHGSGVHGAVFGEMDGEHGDPMIFKFKTNSELSSLVTGEFFSALCKEKG